MSRSFDVLNRDLKIHQHFLLEASAGTGKTFSIQHLVTRLLIESSSKKSEPIPLNQILIMTFTRAATRELRARIRTNIEHSIFLLNHWLQYKNTAQSTPDYLLAVMELGAEHVINAKKYLQRALFGFDQAQIFTIHSFCSRMLLQHALESDLGINVRMNEKGLLHSEWTRLIRDFFRTEIRAENYSPSQLNIIIKGDPKQKKLLNALQNGYECIEQRSFQQLFQEFTTGMQKIKQSFGLSSKLLIEDFKRQQNLYRNEKNGSTKKESLEIATRFAALFDHDSWTELQFDQLIEDGLIWISALDPTLLKNPDGTIPNLHFPTFTSKLKEILGSLVNEARSFSHLLVRLAGDCKSFIKRYMQEEEKMTPDDILKKMEVALEEPIFQKKVRDSFQAAIIDEFQDTDNSQWSIFKCLFLPNNECWHGYLTLVGDPKQSIYSFRQADIYTYLEAAKALGLDSCFSLDTNYRSQKPLVDALNILFNKVKNFIPLPKLKEEVPYRSVKASDNASTLKFNDERGVMHFMIADGSKFEKSTLHEMENQFFFPFIANEIISLQQNASLNFSQFAILVRDRYQAERISKYFDNLKIPYTNQKGTYLTDSKALPALVDLLEAVLNPKDLGAVNKALGGTILGFCHSDFTENSDENIIRFVRLRKILIEQDFSAFFKTLLHTHFANDNATVLEKILKRQGGLEFYRELYQIADLIIDKENKEWHCPEGLILFLDHLKKNEDEDEEMKSAVDSTKEGVKILTLHFSKGLEFDIVFALGLVNRSSAKEDFYPVQIDHRVCLCPITEEPEKRILYLKENDAEKMRQLYVALTRAKYRLYIPAALSHDFEMPNIGEASPIELFLARFGATSIENLYSKMNGEGVHELIRFMENEGSHSSITFSINEFIKTSEKREERAQKEVLIPPSTVAVPGDNLVMTSFSTLTRKLHEEYTSHDEMTPPHAYENEIKTPHTLPANSQTGLILHSIFENISFQDVKNYRNSTEFRSIVRPFIQHTPYREWENAISDIVYHTLKVPIGLCENHFSLSDIPSTQMYREMPFLFQRMEPLNIEGIVFSKGFIKGVVDLIFCYRGKYYILDWKSNWLGNDLEMYQRQFLQDAMSENHYFLQASLYVEALERYLKSFEVKPFHECFGGVIYLFLRGIDQEAKTGIFHFIPQLSSSRELIYV